MSVASIRRVALLLLVLVSLSFSGYNLFVAFRNWDSTQIGRDDVSVWENRLHPLKQKLPPGIQTMGYLGEWDLPGGRSSITDQLHEYNLTIYALAPVILRRGSNYAWIVGNFGTKQFEPWLQNSIGNHETEAIGGGIYLIHKVKK